MSENLTKHPVYIPDTKDTDFSDFRVLIVYANSPMDNLFPVGISSIGGMCKRHNIDYNIFDTTYYPNDGRLGVNKNNKKNNRDKVLTERLQVAEFDYNLVGIKYIETDVFDDFRKKVLEYKPSLIMLSTVEPTHKFGVQLLKKVRDLNIPTFVGGCFAIFSPAMTIEDESVDYVCVGEGEYASIEFCKTLANKGDLTKVPGVWAKDDKGNIIKNPKGPLVEMGDLPMLDFNEFDEKRIYRPMSGKLWKMAPIEFSRGCPYKCTFCSAPVFEEEFKDVGTWSRSKPIPQIENEMKYYIKELGIEYFYFVSETFLAMPKKRFEAFCEMYKKIKLPFWFNTRPETISEEKVKMLEEINCHRMSIGIESGNQKYAQTMLKRMATNDRIEDACKIVSRSSIELSVNNVVGFPDETREMMFDTINLNRTFTANSHSCAIFQPYRGTTLHTYCVEKGYFGKDELAEDLTYASPLKQNHITHEEIQGVAKCFALYTKLPKDMFDFIKIAEKEDAKGKKMFEELMIIYKNVYATKAESDVGGGTRYLVVKKNVEKDKIYQKLTSILNQNY
jgi:anaerobic magnesium-protoporphyrin IX monomethyl ester cyclase